MKINLLNPTTAFFTFIVIFVIFFVTNASPFIYYDGYGSYHTTQCLINEQRWACRAKPEYFPEHTYHAVSEFNGRYSTVYAPGSAIVNLPLQLFAQIFNGDRNMYNDLFTATNGHTLFEGVGFLLTASFLSIFSVILQYKSLRLLNFSEKLAILSTIASFISSYFIWYILLNHAFNHTTEIFALSLFLYTFLKASQNENLTKKWWFLVGVSVGLAVISRPTLAIILIPISLYLIFNKNFFKKASMIFLGGLPFLILWVSYNYDSYGVWVGSGYSYLFSQHFVFDEWNGLNILFSKYRGWFIYSPVMLFSIISLIISIFKKFDNKNSLKIIFSDEKFFIYVLSLWMILGTVLVYGFWPIWWGGGSYGQRFLISTLPFTNVGIALFFDFNSKTSIRVLKYSFIFLTTIFVTWSGLLTILYRFTPVAELVPKTETTSEMKSGDKYTTLDILNYHVSLIKNSDSVIDYFKNLANSVSGGTNFVVFLPKFMNSVLWFDENMTEAGVRTLFFDNENLSNRVELVWQENTDAVQFLIEPKQIQREAYINCFVQNSYCVYENIKIKAQKVSLEKYIDDDWKAIKVNMKDGKEIKIWFKEPKNLFIHGVRVVLE
ncbi:MAG: hypothetical protein KatS3mg085_680 [Candidatus Dojkabacteria bacterium]|nr:MAG: hypothetical protein KatS3mg085_680 [Candidatus Dojkabacteria bacterium]